MPPPLPSLLAPYQRWGLASAYQAAAVAMADPRQLRVLVNSLFASRAEVRWHAADAARRISERQPALLEPFAERLLGALAASSGDNWRTRAHLGLVVARVAHTRVQTMRAAALLRPLLGDPSNLVPCTAIEGLGLLASQERQLSAEVELILEEALLTGTAAVRSRARHALARLHLP